MTNKSTKSSVPVILITFLVVVLQGCAQTPRKQSLADQPAVKEDKVGAMGALITKLAEKEELPQGTTESIWLAVISPTGTDTMWQVGHPMENKSVRLFYEVLYSKTTIDRARIAVLVRPVREAGQAQCYLTYDRYFWFNGQWIAAQNLSPDMERAIEREAR